VVLLPVIGLEAYGFREVVRSARESPTAMLYIATFESLYAAWIVLQLEFFPRLSGVRRRTQVWFAAGLSIGSAAVILLWLMPQFALALISLIFIAADFVGFQVARDLTRGLRKHARS
jgi:hypothetical protein